MAKIDLTVKSIMGTLTNLDSSIEDEYDKLDEYNRFSEHEENSTYKRIYNELSASIRDQNGFRKLDGNGIINPKTGRPDISGGIALIPGDRFSCEPTLLVFLFPVFNKLGESYPNNILDLRLNQTWEYLDACPSVKNVIFYGPVWDSTLWKMYRDRFLKINCYLKLFFTVYTVLKHKRK